MVYDLDLPKQLENFADLTKLTVKRLKRTKCDRIVPMVREGWMCELYHSEQMYRDVLSNIHGLVMKRSRHRAEREYGVQMLN
jgi:hypothetical protein